MGELEKLLDNIIKKGYPELLDCDIQVEYKRLDDAIAEYGEQDGGGFFIEIDKKIESANKSVKIGALASELSHIAEDVKSSFLGRKKDMFLYRISKKYRTKDEKNNDVRTILRGFGNELYDAVKFAQHVELPYHPENGLSLRELEILLNKE